MTIEKDHIHGWLIINKPKGLSSSQVVGRLKSALRRGGYPKNIKIGHGGTLDPLATGVLPVAIGEATKLAGSLLNGPKGYDFSVCFGVSTTTDDAEGVESAKTEILPNRATLERVLSSFHGKVIQKPPAFSALKIAGKRAYALARAGQNVDLAPRIITIHKLALIEFSPQAASFSVYCSKGTYVRSLARDIAQQTGSLGHVSALHRTQAGPFLQSQAILLDFACEMVHQHRLEQILLPIQAGLDDIPALAITQQQAAFLKQGRKLAKTLDSPQVTIATGRYLAMLESVPIALVEVDESQIRVLRGFNCN